MKSYFNLPENVIFCKKCVLSNQRPSSIPEFKHTKNRDGNVKVIRISRSENQRETKIHTVCCSPLIPMMHSQTITQVRGQHRVQRLAGTN